MRLCTRAVALLFLATTLAACSEAEDRPDAATEAPASTPVDQHSLVGKAPPATRNFPSVVILEGDDPDAVAEPTEPAILDQINTEFVPEVLVVRLGRAVEFRNSEDIVHNVNLIDLTTNSSLINVGTEIGSSQRFTIEETGVYLVLCDIHPAMEAYIVVTPSPHAVVADVDGSFRFPDVPPGTYTLSVWNLDETLQTQQAVKIEGPRTEVIADTTR